MSHLSQMEQSIISTICNPDAASMATSLDRALTHMVQSNLQFPSEDFEADYYNVDCLRNAIRAYAQQGTEDLKKEPKEQVTDSSRYAIYSKEELIRFLELSDEQIQLADDLIDKKNERIKYLESLWAKQPTPIEQPNSEQVSLEPLIKALLDWQIPSVVSNLDEALHMLVYVREGEFNSIEINNAYSCIRMLRDAIGKVNTLSQVEA